MFVGFYSVTTKRHRDMNFRSTVPLTSLFSLAVVASIIGCQTQQDEVHSAASEERNAKLVVPFVTEELHDDFVSVSRITPDNVDALILEVQRRKIRRLELVDPERRSSREQDRDLLRKICSGCPKLEALSVNSLNLSLADLSLILASLPDIRDLRLHSCRFDTAPGDDAPARLNTLNCELTCLHAMYCTGLNDDVVADFLKATPKLEELRVADLSTQQLVYSGRGWPLSSMQHLKRFSVYTDGDDQLVVQILKNVPSLTALSIRYCRNMAGADWIVKNPQSLSELDLAGCTAFTEENLSALLKQLPSLRSLNLWGCKKVTGESLNANRLAGLTTLYLSGTQLAPKFVANTLDAANHLEFLSLHSIFPSGDTPYSFAHLNELKTLHVDAVAVPQDFAATLSSSIENLSIEHCSVTNSSLATMLQRLHNLRTLKLIWLSGPSGSERDAEAVTGAGWDFSNQSQLRELNLRQSRYIEDSVVVKIAEQLPGIKTLVLGQNGRLTGTNWKLERLSALENLTLSQLSKLKNGAMLALPKSLTQLQIEKCPLFTGKSWRLAALRKLQFLKVSRCESLTSLGQDLPLSLQQLTAFECRKLKCGDLDYAGLRYCRTISFQDCYEFDVDHMFARLPKHCRKLQSLNLNGCPDLASTGWDMSPLRPTLARLTYQEAEPAYVGGISQENATILKNQLPECDIAR